MADWDEFNSVYAVLRDAVLEMPTGDPEDPTIRAVVDKMKSLLASEYLVEVEPGKYKYTSEGIARLMTKMEPCEGPPPDAIMVNAKVPPRKH